MYICICNAITDKHIRKEVANGACRMRDLNQRLGICSDCGKCGKHAHKVLREARVETAPLPA